MCLQVLGHANIKAVITAELRMAHFFWDSDGIVSICVHVCLSGAEGNLAQIQHQLGTAGFLQQPKNMFSMRAEIQIL